MRMASIPNSNILRVRRGSALGHAGSRAIATCTAPLATYVPCHDNGHLSAGNPGSALKTIQRPAEDGRDEFLVRVREHSQMAA